MHTKLFRSCSAPCFIAFILFLLLSPEVSNAQENRESRRSLTLSASQEHTGNVFLDEMGVHLSFLRHYESWLDIENYKLDTGDLLGFSIEGNVQAIYRGLRVNSQGSVLIPNVGIIEVKGLLFYEAESLISEKINEELPGTQTRLILEQPRTIQIHVTGNVPFSGPQLILAQTRLDQAVFSAFFQKENWISEDDHLIQLLPVKKYPAEFIESNQFALRSISITRSDGSAITGDIVRYLKTGEKDSNPVIQQGDIIHINQYYDYHPRVSVSGGVNKALEMEYHPDDTIDRLITMAGGTTFDVVKDKVIVTRSTTNGLERLVLDDSVSIAQYQVQPNDRIVIPKDRDLQSTHNAQIYGEAAYTGRFSIEDGVTTLFELLEMAGGLTESALPQAAYLTRTQPGRTEYGFEPAINPTTLRRTSDQLLQGFEYLQLEAQVSQNRVFVDLNDEEQLRSVRIYHGDLLHIPKNEGTVFVFGQVNNPGYYNFDESASYHHYIAHAGGYALSADEERIFIIKSQTNSWFKPGDVPLEPGDLVFVDRVPFDELQASRTYDLQKRSQRNSNIQLVMTGLTTITSIITAYIAVTR
ncbi:SLBB domain-containing protein [Balneolaceae bacterium ANBcel3]|nr:SLBB domain-containing protein [Balneolaceae bacterium ANBcel3]